MSKIIFAEEQKFGSPLLYLSMGVIYGGTVIFFLIALYKQFVLDEPWGDKPMTDSGLITGLVCILGVFILSAYFLFGSRLKVEVTTSNINFSFKPMIIKIIVFKRNDIEKFEVREYKPIKEYGGWGVKVGNKKTGKAYNVSGNIGLQLYLKDGKKVLIGTQRGDAIQRAMNKMMEIR